MPEEYREYRRRRKPLHKQSSRKVFSKKLKYQTVISLAMLISVCLLRFNGPESPLNTYIKNAFLYKPDTTGITKIFNNIFETNSNKGIQDEKNTLFKNL